MTMNSSFRIFLLSSKLWLINIVAVESSQTDTIITKILSANYRRGSMIRLNVSVLISDPFNLVSMMPRLLSESPLLIRLIPQMP